MKNAGIEFNEKRVALFTETTDKELEPCFSNYKVPVLFNGGFIVWNSLAIMEYLAEKYPESKGIPTTNYSPDDLEADLANSQKAS